MGSSGQDLYIRKIELIDLINKAITEYKKRGIERAKTEREYRIALSAEVLEQKAEGTKVTIISDICRGKKEIADLKFKRDVADTLYKSAEEAINAYKLELRTIEGQIQREWGR